MTPRSSISLAVLAVGVLLAISSGSALAQTSRDGDAHVRDGGSTVPCAVPLAWRIARVDRGFGVSDLQARRAVAQAARLWQDAHGATLFVHDEATGFPIRLVFDERQARTVERLQAEQRIERTGVELDRERDALLARVRAHEASVGEHEGIADSLRRRTAEHNETVRTWNERGGAPDDVAARLQGVAEALDVERRSLEERRAPIEREGRDIEEASLRLERRADQLRGSLEEMERAHPSASVESGVYREAVRTENGRPTSVSREIRLYRFADERELVVVAAHELGHALGLGHRADPRSVMHAEHGPGGNAVVVPEDARALAALCADR
jgi:hypothetical protein